MRHTRITCHLGCCKLTAVLDCTGVCTSYFQQDPAGNVVRQQTGVFRTNCMDNLDRTNVVQVRVGREGGAAQHSNTALISFLFLFPRYQSLFARRFILKAVGRLEDQDSVLTSPFSSFEHSFKNGV